LQHKKREQENEKGQGQKKTWKMTSDKKVVLIFTLVANKVGK